MFESRISAGAKEKLPTRASGEPDEETTSSWSYDMEVTKRICGMILRQLYKVATPCMDDHQFKEEEK